MHLIHVKYMHTHPLKGYKKVLCLRNIMWTISLEVGKSISLWSKKWIETRKLHSYLYGGIISRLFTYIICTQSSLLESDFWNQKALLMLICFFWACLFSRNCTCCEFREVIYLMATSSTGMYTYVYSIENVIHILLLCAVWTNWIHQRNRKRLGARFLTEIYASGRFSGYFGKLFVWTIRARRVFW